MTPSDWQVKQATEDDVWFDEYVQDVLTLSPVASVARERKLGSVVVAWEEVAPGLVVIEAEGGSSLDRFFAESLTREELAANGYREAGFDTSIQKSASWDDIMAKAKRLIQSGNVTVLRNGYQNVVGHVVGDHGAYNTEFSRSDPDSRVLTSWSCECPWDQFAFQRTRQWKKYEARPCAHVLALDWKARSTPLDTDQLPDNFQGTPGQKGPGVNQEQMSMPGMSAPQQDLPSVPYDKGRPMPSNQELQTMGQPNALQPDAVGSPADQGVIPPFPGAQQEMWAEWQGPGSTPGGGQSPPWAVSVPGAKMPSPFNPIQYPGGTYSKVAAEEFLPESFVRMNAADQYGIWEGKSEAHGAGSYAPIPRNSQGTVRSVDPTTGWVEVVFEGPARGNGPMEPYHLHGFYEPKVLSPMPGVRPPGVWGPRRR